MKRKKPGLRLDASITVEACILVPLMFLIIATMIFFSFYLHDAIKANMMLGKLLDDAVNYTAYEVNPETGEIQYDNTIHQSVLYFAGASKGDKEQILEAYCKEQLSDGFFLTDIRNVDVAIKFSSVVITANLRVEIPIPWIQSLFQYDAINRKLTLKKSYFKREELTRVLTVMTETGSQIKGVSEAMDKVKEIVNKIR